MWPWNDLPLTRFETYLFHEDRPAYPCWFLTRLRFQGRFDRVVLEEAWERVLARHPLLTAVVRRRWTGGLYWKWGLALPPRIRWSAAPAPGGWAPWTPSSLEAEPGVQLIVVEADGVTELCLYTHHALYDGAGLFAVLDDLLVHYARGRGEAGEPAALRPDLFPDRNRFGLSFRDKLRLVPSMALGLAASLQLGWRSPRPLGTGPAVGDDERAFEPMPAVVSRRLEPEAFAQLRGASKRLGAGLHDLLIRDAHAAAGTWLKEEAGAGDLEWVYLLVPVNLRRPADLELPAANLVGLIILGRQLKSTLRRGRLLQRTKEDLAWVKRHHLGYTFLVRLALSGLLPGGIRRFTRRRGCRATLLLTNLGQHFAASRLCGPDGRLRVPGAVLEDVSVAAPVRPGTAAGLLVGVYGGRIWIDLAYDPRVLSAAQADRLADAFVAQLRQTAAAGAAAPA